MKMAVHEADAYLCQTGKSIRNRKRNSPLVSKIISSVVRTLIIKPIMKRFPLEAFEPDNILTDGQDLRQYGFDARIIHIPGHSMGSIGILTGEGNFLSGDTINNRKKPTIANTVENEAALSASLSKIKTLNIRNVYPGHGKPFSWTEMRF